MTAFWKTPAILEKILEKNGSILEMEKAGSEGLTEKAQQENPPFPSTHLHRHRKKALWQGCPNLLQKSYIWWKVPRDLYSTSTDFTWIWTGFRWTCVSVSDPSKLQNPSRKQSVSRSLKHLFNSSNRFVRTLKRWAVKWRLHYYYFNKARDYDVICYWDFLCCY